MNILDKTTGLVHKNVTEDKRVFRTGVYQGVNASYVGKQVTVYLSSEFYSGLVAVFEDGHRQAVDASWCFCFVDRVER